MEIRTCSVIEQPTEILDKEKWASLTSVIRIKSRREITSGQRTTEECGYYICSKALKASDALEKIRKHWSIENNLHWSLDVAFAEDQSRMRAGDEDKNYALIRKIVINLVSLDKTKLSIQRKRLKASRSDAFRQQLLRI